MTNYKTEQKSELINFLAKNSHRSFTIDEICEGMSQDSTCISPPGKSTVYRLIPKLLADNTIKQFNKENSRRATYQIVGGQACHFHLHLKCTKCGKLFHAGQEITTMVCNRISESENFKISTSKTVLFGLCENCM